LLFSSFAYAVLGALGAKGIMDWIRGHSKLSATLAIALPLIIVGSTWREYRDAFSTFNLTSDQEEALNWLSEPEQDDGRVMLVPLNCYLYSHELRATFKPMSYSWWHGKEVVYENPFESGVTGTISSAARNGTVPIDDVCDVLGVRYLAVDKTDARSSNYVFGDSFVKRWGSETLDIYRHEDPYPRIFTTEASLPDTAHGTQEWGDISPQYAALIATPGQGVTNYSLVHPGKYRVEFSSSESSWLILTESYYPGWVAKIGDKTLPSKEVLGGLNAWYVDQTGDYEITLEFTPSAQRIGARIITIITVTGIAVFFIVRYIKRRQTRQGPCR
jgi:hypothetical protein